MSIINENTLLLPNNNNNNNKSMNTSSTSIVNSQIEFGLNLIINFVVIEGLTKTLLIELEERGYVIPNNLLSNINLTSTEEEEEEEQNEDELNLYKLILNLPQHLKLLSIHLPIIANIESEVIEGEDVGGSSSGTTVRPSNRTTNSSHNLGTTSGSGVISNSNRPSPLSSQFQSSGQLSIENPSSLFLASLLFILISLQTEGVIEEIGNRGVKRQLRRLKVRKELSGRIYALVTGLLDSYLGSSEDGGGEEGEEQDVLVDLLYKDFPLHYDSRERRTVCALDLLLSLSSYPQLIEVERLISHPVILATTEYVWRNGLNSPTSSDLELTWTETLFKLERFSTPRLLHTQTYLISTLYSALSVYILIFSRYSHFYSFNPLAPDATQIGIPEHLKGRGSSFISSFLWYFWILGTIGWMGEVIKVWYHRGPNPSLPLSSSTLLPLISHILVFTSLLCRSFILISGPEWSAVLLPTSVSLLAWSIPFLATSRILPQNLPSFGSPCHFNFKDSFSSSNLKKTSSSSNYSAPIKSIPESHRALRNLEEKLGGLIQFGGFFVLWGSLLLWSLSGELDYPGIVSSVFFLPSILFSQSKLEDARLEIMEQIASPIEARTTLAFTFILGIILAYFAGGRSSITSHSSPLLSSTTSSTTDESKLLLDLDGFNRYGREVAFRSRQERLTINRYFTYYSPSPSSHSLTSSQSHLSAFSTPPLPPPLNLFIPFITLLGMIFRMAGRLDLEMLVQMRGREWVWKLGISPLGLGGLLEKGWKILRGKM